MVSIIGMLKIKILEMMQLLGQMSRAMTTEWETSGILNLIVTRRPETPVLDASPT